MTKEVRKEPEPFFYCKWGVTGKLCSDCKRNHLNSEFSTEEISNWWQPMANGSRKWCRDYIKIGNSIPNYSIMTNEEKAEEIAKNDALYGEDPDNNSKTDECYIAALEMAKWKDEYYKKLLDLLVESGADADIINNYTKDCIEL